MRKNLSKFALRILGWKIKGSIPADLKKCVLVAAPHTSYWDFVIARLTFYFMHLNVRFLIKKELFIFPFRWYIRWLGCIPVDKNNSKKAVFTAVDAINKHETIHLVITPEGTRKYNDKWKRGFYFIALQAHIPIVLTYVDYARKEGGFGPVIHPTGNYEEDFIQIEAFYKTISAKFPENFNLSNK